MKTFYVKNILLPFAGLFTAAPVLALLFAALLPAKIFAQAPTISYASPQTYTQGVTIPQLVPTSRNVGDNAYAVITTSIGSGFSGPTGVARDASANIYVADYGDKVVKKIPVGGGSPVIVGSGFSAPIAVAIDRSGNLYVADYGSHSIFEVPVGGGNPQLISSNFNQPTGVAVDGAGNVFVADQGDNAVYELFAGGGRATLGSGFSKPTGVAVDGAGNVYIADSGNKALKEIPVGTSVPYIVFDTSSPPYGVAVDAIGDIFVTEGGNGFGAVEEYVLSGNLAGFGTGLSSPGGLTVDGTGKVYVADQGNNVVKKMTPGGGYFINRALPPGLNFDTNTGIISRTPASVSPATNYIVTTYNSAGVSSSATVNIAVLTDNANLTSLQIDRGALTPPFATGKTAYTATVVNGVTSMTLTPTADNPNSTILVNNTKVASGAASGDIPLNPGANTISIVVTAPDGVTTQTYTLTVTRTPSTNANLSSLVLSRGTLNPVFASTTTGYTANVVNGVTSLTITPTAVNTGAVITVDGTGQASGTATGPIPLAVGPNVITTVVTSEDGSATQTYTVTVTRAAATNDLLSGLKLSVGVKSPVFTSDETSYTASEANSVSSITVTATTDDPNATLLVDGTDAAVSGNPSDPITLIVGSNTITVQVTAQDGVTSQTYTIVVTRASGPANSFDAALRVGVQNFEPLLSDDGVIVHQAVSPNGDGINDFLTIDNINQYPDNKLTILNRSGQLIYQATGYDNSSKVFDGQSNKNGQMQLPGTYFYQLDYTVKGIAKTKTGFIVLKY